MIRQRNIKYRRSYFLINPTAMKLRIMKGFFWRTKESLCCLPSSLWNEVDYPSRAFRTWKFEKKHGLQALFWSLSISEIEDMIKNCPTRLTLCNRQPSEPTIKHPVPQERSTKLTADLFQLYGHYYLLVVDYNFKFVAIKNLKNSQSLTVMNKCKKITSQYGIPNELITDNGP